MGPHLRPHRDADLGALGLRAVRLIADGEQGPGTFGAIRGVSFVGWPEVQERIVLHQPAERFRYQVITGMPHLADHLGRSRSGQSRVAPAFAGRSCSTSSPGTR